MITMNVYPDAHDGDALAAKVNAVLENYKSHHGMVLRTNLLPPNHLIARQNISSQSFFVRQNFIEAAFARFKLVDGIGCSIVYSHRIYGEKVGDQMSAWIDHNGAKIEKTLMEWNNMPSPASVGELPRKQ